MANLSLTGLFSGMLLPPSRPPDVSAEHGYRTWRGERGEEWSSAQGLESILLSIQSLMSSNPYENEPGFEDANEAQDKKNQKDYVQKVLNLSDLFRRTTVDIVTVRSATKACESLSSSD